MSKGRDTVDETRGNLTETTVYDVRTCERRTPLAEKHPRAFARGEERES